MRAPSWADASRMVGTWPGYFFSKASTNRFVPGRAGEEPVDEDRAADVAPRAAGGHVEERRVVPAVRAEELHRLQVRPAGGLADLRDLVRQARLGDDVLDGERRGDEAHVLREVRDEDRVEVEDR